MEGEAEHAPLAAAREAVVGDVEEERRVPVLRIEPVDLAGVLPDHIEVVGIARRRERRHRAVEPARRTLSARMVPADGDLSAALVPKMVSSPAPPEDRVGAVRADEDVGLRLLGHRVGSWFPPRDARRRTASANSRSGPIVRLQRQDSALPIAVIHNKVERLRRQSAPHLVQVARACPPPAAPARVSGGGGEAVADGAVAQRLGEVDAPDRLGAVEIGERAGDLEDAVIAAGREAHLVGGGAEKRHRALRRAAPPARSGRRALGVGGHAARRAQRSARAWSARAAATRLATAALASAGAGRMRSAAVTAGTSMRMSMRSRSGPERRAW